MLWVSFGSAVRRFRPAGLTAGYTTVLLYVLLLLLKCCVVVPSGMSFHIYIAAAVWFVACKARFGSSACGVFLFSHVSYFFVTNKAPFRHRIKHRIWREGDRQRYGRTGSPRWLSCFFLLLSTVRRNRPAVTTRIQRVAHVAGTYTNRVT